MHQDQLETLYNSISELLTDMVFKFHEQNVDEEKLIIEMPQYLIDLFSRSANAMFYYNTVNGRIQVFRGIRIQPSWDQSIVMFHPDYPLYKYEWMIVKVPLNPLYFSINDKVRTWVMNITNFITDYGIILNKPSTEN